MLITTPVFSVSKVGLSSPQRTKCSPPRTAPEKECFYLIRMIPIISGARRMSKGSGYGKVILFGEHFVVHGVPGIVSAIDSTTDAEVKEKPRKATAKKNGCSSLNPSKEC
jgi:hypothetical protein